MKQYLVWRVFTCCCALTSISAAIAAPSVGQRLAASCTSCHGTTGVSAGGKIPSLAGRSKPSIVKSMNAFKSSVHNSSVMEQLAKGYTAEQIELIAIYFAMKNNK